jgi:hypothetical protein
MITREKTFGSFPVLKRPWTLRTSPQDGQWLLGRFFPRAGQEDCVGRATCYDRVRRTGPAFHIRTRKLASIQAKDGEVV